MDVAGAVVEECNDNVGEQRNDFPPSVGADKVDSVPVAELVGETDAASNRSSHPNKPGRYEAQLAPPLSTDIVVVLLGFVSATHLDHESTSLRRGRTNSSTR